MTYHKKLYYDSRVIVCMCTAQLRFILFCGVTVMLSETHMHRWQAVGRKAGLFGGEDACVEQLRVKVRRYNQKITCYTMGLYRIRWNLKLFGATHHIAFIYINILANETRKYDTGLQMSFDRTCSVTPVTVTPENKLTRKWLTLVIAKPPAIPSPIHGIVHK